MTKETYYMTKETYYMTKETYYMTKETCANKLSRSGVSCVTQLTSTTSEPTPLSACVYCPMSHTR
jgi:hypothetical protein